jgi:NADH-quinone oxidoreductase subunit L
VTGALLLAVPLLPLLTAVGALTFGKRLPYGGGELVVGALILSLLGLLELHSGSAAVSVTWLQVGGYHLTLGLEITALTVFVALVVAATALGVGIYSLGYMAGKADRPRFFAELGLFVGAMLALVLADSLILLFAAWELVGVASYLLIGFHYDEQGAAPAALKAFLMTRIGDVGLLLGWLLALVVTGTTDIGGLLDAAHGGEITPAVATAIALLLFAGAVGKSAQLPLTAWLPDAMVGPTPVSALLHSATMVAAGVFLVLRLYPLFALAPAAVTVVFWVGAVSALVAALIATAEVDLKRVLAWSTTSQLGEMMIALGLGGPLAAAFHLTTHAAFKSTLFLAAGSVQEQTQTRDLRQLGGLARWLPVTGIIFTLAAAALAGLPPLSGFWSEESILAVSAHHGVAPAALIVLLVFLAGIYIGRAATATFLGPRHGPDAREPAWSMIVGMLVLVVPAAGLGWLLYGHIETLLPWHKPPELGEIWRYAAIGAAITGAAIGIGRAWHAGPVPAVGRFPEMLKTALTAATQAPAHWTLHLAQLLERLEQGLDHGAQAIARAAERLAGRARFAEDGLDGAARGTAGATWRLALGTEATEAYGFGRGGDRLALGFAGGGEQLRQLQSGTLYLYTLGLFVWVMAALIIGVVLLVS